MLNKRNGNSLAAKLANDFSMQHNLAKIDQALSDGADIDAFDRDCTALGMAAQWGNEPLVAYLLKRGASIERGRVNGQSPLGIAVEHGRVTAVRTLLASLADVNAANCDGQTPLICAVGNDYAAMARLLLFAGADHACTLRGGGHSALHVAASRSSACVRLLLVFRADPNAMDQQGRTPLWGASTTACARLMIAAGASVSCADRCGYTPLHSLVAAFGRQVDEAQLLIDAGVDLQATTREGHTALWLARNNKKMLELLAKAELLSPEERAEARTRLGCSLEAEKRMLARDRLDMIRSQVFSICVGLQSLELPAFVTTQIVEQACTFAHLATMHQIWNLVVKIKHFQYRAGTMQ